MDTSKFHLERLVVCEQFTGVDWQLPTAVPAVDRMLIGWMVAPESHDGDVPLPVAHLLSRVLCRQASVTFASALRPPMMSSLLPREWVVGRHFEWVSATNASEAERLFYTDGFSWSAQGQVAILSPVDAPILGLNDRHLQLLAVPGLFGEMASHGALGVMLPGVDGQVAGIYSFASGLANALRFDLAEDAEKMGAKYVVTNEETFGELLRS